MHLFYLKTWAKLGWRCWKSLRSLGSWGKIALITIFCLWWRDLSSLISFHPLLSSIQRSESFIIMPHARVETAERQSFAPIPEIGRHALGMCERVPTFISSHPHTIRLQLAWFWVLKLASFSSIWIQSSLIPPLYYFPLSANEPGW